jgi:hypothetical protein
MVSGDPRSPMASTSALPRGADGSRRRWRSPTPAADVQRRIRAAHGEHLRAAEEFRRFASPMAIPDGRRRYATDPRRRGVPAVRVVDGDP